MTGGKRDAEAAGYIWREEGAGDWARQGAREVGGFPMLRRMIALLQSVAKNVKVVGARKNTRSSKKK